MTDRLTPTQFQEADGVEDWRVLGEGACIFFATPSFAASARLVQAIGERLAVEQLHHVVERPVARHTEVVELQIIVAHGVSVHQDFAGLHPAVWWLDRA